MDDALTIDGLDPLFLPLESREGSAIWRARHRWEPPARILIHGPSGRGKTTFLKILYGMQLPFAGHWEWGGRLSMDAHASPDRRLGWRRDAVAAVFQDFFLFEKLTGEENLRLLPALAPEAGWERAMAWADELGLADILPRPVEQYSPGQRQRLALLRAWRRPFRWLLLDEPWSHLDRGNRAKAIALLEEVLAERGAGLILTHLEAEPPIPVSQIYAL